MKLSYKMLLALAEYANDALWDLPMCATDIICMLAMQANHNSPDGKCIVQLDAGHRPWNLPLAELKAIEGEWRFMPQLDPHAPDWLSVGIGEADGELSLPGEVNYIGNDHLVLRGDNGDCAVFWVFKRSTT